jgi:hypothetical protein
MQVTSTELTASDADRLRHIARDAHAQMLDDPAVLHRLRAEFSGDPVLCALGGTISTTIADTKTLLIRNTPVDSEAAVIALFQCVANPTSVGNVGQIVHKVTPRRDGRRADISGTEDEFPPHTDSTFLRHPHEFIALACVQSEVDGGGDSFVLSVAELRATLDSQHGPGVLACLAEPAYPFLMEDPLYGDGVQLVPVLGHDDTVRYRRDVLRLLVSSYPGKCSERHQAALKVLDDLLDDRSLHHYFTMSPGDLLILDNRCVLHGRTAIRPGAQRELLRIKGFAMSGPAFEVLT